MSKKKKKNKVKRRDPRHIGVPNINFSLTKVDDDREKQYSKQRKKMGFDDSETWCLSATMANFMVPRLKRFLEITDGMHVVTKEHKKMEKAVLRAFELILEEDYYNEKKQKQIAKGLKLLGKNINSFWW